MRTIMKWPFETDEGQAQGHVEEPVTLAQALSDMDPSLAVEPVAEAEEIPSEAEELPGEVEVEDIAAEADPEPEVGTPEADEEAEAAPEEEELVEELADELEPETDEEAEQAFTLQLGDVELEIEVEDEETQAALETMQNDLARVKDVDQLYARVQQTAEQNAIDRASLEAIYDELRIDPVGYITSKVHPTIQEALLKEMLLEDDLLKVAEDAIGEWMEDPASRREQAADTKVARIERRRAAEETKAQQSAERNNAKAIWAKVMELTPTDMEHDEAKMFHRDALVDVQRYVQAREIETLNPEELPRILATRMRLYGIGENAGRKPAKPADDRGKKLASETGERFKKKVARRRKVASAPAGAGGAPGRTQLPKGATLDDALKQLKQRVGQ